MSSPPLPRRGRDRPRCSVNGARAARVPCRSSGSRLDQRPDAPPGHHINLRLGHHRTAVVERDELEPAGPEIGAEEHLAHGAGQRSGLSP
ncbi:hypothetical protein [Blastococcus saxobsidens]|uniref:hypothetical protein n=1 Tax=Blastococcus saxobsidens TaxID=138336 RepID=UPI000CEBCBA6|nr:hypothetical protein [Blastococcus saxobsidens]